MELYNFRCKLCNFTTNRNAKLDIHYGGKKHKMMVLYDSLQLQTGMEVEVEGIKVQKRH